MMKRFVLTLGVMALTGALSTTAASASNLCGPTGGCTGGSVTTIDDVVTCTISGKAISGGITVTGDCILLDDHITGGLTMDAPGATLNVCGSTISQGVTITGGTCANFGIGDDDSGAGCGTVAIPIDTPDKVSGGVSATGLTGTAVGVNNPFCDTGETAGQFGAAFEAEDSNLGGGVTLSGNGYVELEGDNISGSVEVTDNTSIGTNDFSALVQGNTISGALNCSGNVGGVSDSADLHDLVGNLVISGGAFGQCAGF